MSRIRTWTSCFLCAAILASGCKLQPLAAFEPTVDTSYNTAVQGQDALDGLDVTVKERTVSSMTNVSSEKEVKIKVSGIKGNSLKADVLVSTEEGESESYYKDGYYYASTSDGDRKRQMERSDIWRMIN
ncbi:MAG: hypothetical protein SOX32_11420, partial [Candidatus Choladocola sp.]|nr:hypothetical protein [Candidatus Choladocola sp.]